MLVALLILLPAAEAERVVAALMPKIVTSTSKTERIFCVFVLFLLLAFF